MQTLRPPLGEADLVAFSEANPGWRVELSAGRLIVSPPTGWETGRRNGALTAKLYRFAEDHGFVALDSSAGVRLPNGDILSPDAALVARSAWASLSRAEADGIPTILPAVVVELRSKSDRRKIVTAKCQDWFEQGVSYVVLLDPYEHDVRTWGTPPPGFVDLSDLVV